MEKTLRFIGIVDDKMTFVIGDGTARNFNYAIHVKASPGSQLTIHYDDGITSNGTDHIEDEVMNCDGTLQTYSRRIYLPYAMENITLSGSAVRNMNTLRFDGGGYLRDMPVYGSYFTLNRSLEELQLSGMYENAQRTWSPLWNGMPNLKRLILNGTSLSGINFTASNGSRPQKLEILDLSNTNIRNVDISGLSGLISADLRNMRRADYSTEPIAVDTVNASGCPNLKYIDLYNDSNTQCSYKWGSFNFENDYSLISTNFRYNRWLGEINYKGCSGLQAIRLASTGSERFDKASLSGTRLQIKYAGNISLISTYFDGVDNAVANLPTAEEAPNLRGITVNSDNARIASAPMTIDFSRYSKLISAYFNQTYSIQKVICYNNNSLSSLTFTSNLAYPNSIDIQNNANLRVLNFNSSSTQGAASSGYLDAVTLVNNPLLSTVTLNGGKLQEMFNVKQMPYMYTFEANYTHLIGEMKVDGFGKREGNYPVTFRLMNNDTTSSLKITNSNLATLYLTNSTALTDVYVHGSLYAPLSMALDNTSSLTGVWLSGNALQTRYMDTLLSATLKPVNNGTIDFRGNLSGYEPSLPAIEIAQSRGWTVLY